MSLRLAGTCPRAAVNQLASLSRAFSTTPTALSNQIPPESPSYIRLPTPPQSEEKKAPRVRGHLPVPREVFPRLEGDRKVRADYIKQTVPKPKVDRAPENATQRWKQKMANTRRDNLEKGLQELWVRRQKSDKLRDDRVSQKFRQYNKDRVARERKDDVLTRSTVHEGVLDTQVYPDIDRFDRAKQSRERVAKIENSKREARRDALMELYINASNFIVTENELKAEIETIFAENYFKSKGDSMARFGASQNTWDVYGKPTSINNMLETATGTSTKVMDLHETEHDRSVKRQKRIAEEFTGGKME